MDTSGQKSRLRPTLPSALTPWMGFQQASLDLRKRLVQPQMLFWVPWAGYSGVLVPGTWRRRKESHRLQLDTSLWALRSSSPREELDGGGPEWAHCAQETDV